MAGQDGGMLQATKEYASKKGVQDLMRFAGFLDQNGKQIQFSMHDIFLNTNRIDNMPISVIEAAAFGLPIVATEVGGIPYLLTHGENALLVPDDDPEAMSKEVLRLLEEPGLAEQLSGNGRKLAEGFDWSHIIPLWEAAFHEVAG
jgi:glycosyltransferase involved in cell wall biosynthesis